MLKTGRFRIGIKLRAFCQAVSMKASWIGTPISQVNPFPLFHPNLNQITFYHFNQNQTLLCLISSLDGWQLRTFGFLLPVSFPQYDFLFLSQKIDCAPEKGSKNILRRSREKGKLENRNSLHFHFFGAVNRFDVTVIHSFVIETRVRWLFGKSVCCRTVCTREPFSYSKKELVKPFSLFDALGRSDKKVYSKF